MISNKPSKSIKYLVLLILGINCIIIVGFIVIYDGFIQQNLNTICKLYCIYLISQTLASVVGIINIQYIDSVISEYILFVLITFGAKVYVVIASIWIFIPTKHYKLYKILTCYCLPIIYSVFIITLNFIPPTHRRMVILLYHLPCSLYFYISLLILFYWFKKRCYIFCVSENTFLNIYFILAIIATTVSIINIICAILVKYDIISSEYTMLLILCINAFVCIPFITPLFRHLDKIEALIRWTDAEYDHDLNNVVDDDSISWNEILNRNWLIFKQQIGWIIFGILMSIWHEFATNIAYAMYTPNDVLWDVGHELLPEHYSLQAPLDILFWIEMIINIILILIPSFMRHPTVLTMLILVRCLKVSGFVIILRTICFLSTSLPSPDDNCLIGADAYDPPTVWGEIFEFNNISDACGDLIFSGHLSLTLVMVICVSHYYYYMCHISWKFIAFGIQLPIVLIMSVLILMARTHYTVDVFVALYTVPLLYHFLWYILPDPRVLIAEHV